MSIRHRLISAGAVATFASAVLAAPSTACAGTVQTYGSLDEMPPWVRAVFIGAGVVVVLGVVVAVWVNLRQARADTTMVEDALGDVQRIIDSAGMQVAPGGPTVMMGGVPVMVGGRPVASAGATQVPDDPFAEIKATDPAFNEERFKGRVNEVFLAIKYAWAAGDMKPVRRFMSDEQYSAADAKLQAEYVSRGRTANLESLFVTGIATTRVARQGEFDSVTVVVDGTAIASTLDQRTGKLVNPEAMGDGTTPRRFRESWTFVRKAGVASRQDTTIQQCPNCGAPVAEGGYQKCAYCGVQMNDPTLDWVVMHIEHAG